MAVPVAGWLAVALVHSHSWSRLANNGTEPEGGGDERDLDDFTFYLYVGITIFLVLMAGAMSGLTLGLMSLDAVDLEILKRSGSASQKKYAERIVPVLKRPHVLLVTLLVCNAAAAEALPLFLDRLADPVTAVIVSVTAVLLFGEIIPQAACTRYGLQIGAAAAPFVQLLMYATWPISWPIGWVLDQILGERHTALFRRGELKALVDIHKEGQEFGGVLSADEVNIIKGALDMTHKIAKSAMTPMDMVFMLPADAVLDESTLTAILASGHSRIPVHKPGNRGEILGILLVKELIMVDKTEGRSVGRIKIRSLPYIRADTPMYDMLKLFEIGRSHMAVLTQPTAEALARRRQQLELARHRRVRDHLLLDMDSDDDVGASTNASDPPSPQASLTEYDPSEMEPVGIITIEDVLEELLQSEIVDETDQYVDNLHSERVNAALLARGLPPHLRRALSSRNMVPRIGGAAFMAAAAPNRAASGVLSNEEALAAGAAAAEAGVFRSGARDASEDGAAAAAAGPRTKVSFGGATVLPLSRTSTADAATIEAVAAALSPRQQRGGGANLSSASLASLVSHHSTAALRREDGGGGGSLHGAGGHGGRTRVGGSLHGASAAAAVLAVAAERAAERRAALPPAVPRPGDARRSRQLTQGIQEQMDLLQPLLRRVATADAALLSQEARQHAEERAAAEGPEHSAGAPQ